MTKREAFEKEYRLYLLQQFISVTSGVSRGALLVNSKDEIDSRDSLSNCFDVFTIENGNDIYSVSMKFYINRNLLEGYLKIDEIYSFLTNLNLNYNEIFTVNLNNIEDDIEKISEKVLEMFKDYIKTAPDQELRSDCQISFMEFEDFDYYLKFKIPTMHKYNLLIDASLALTSELDKEENKNISVFDRIFEFNDLYIGFLTEENAFAFSDGTYFWYSTDADNIIIDYIKGSNENIEDPQSAYGWSLIEN